MATELVVALDFNDQNKADYLLQQLEGLPVIYKIGLELYLSASSEWMKATCNSGHRIFLDLKFHDIPNTVGSAVVKAAELGVEFLTLHLAGGRRMLDEVEIKLQEALISQQIAKRPKILGVSVLTSFKEEEWIANVSHMAKISGVRTILDTTLHFANLAHEHPAVQGMVCSAIETERVRMKYPDLFLLVPGIRPEGSVANDQARITTPADASKAGASAIVIGRPITQSPDPRTLVENILREIS